MRKIAFAIGVLMLLVVAVAACGGNTGSSTASTTKEPIKIPVVGPMTGSYTVWGMSAWNGASIAADEINATGGVLGRKIELVKFDTKGDPIEGANAAQAIVSDKSYAAEIGPVFSSVAQAMKPILERAHVLGLSSLSTNPKVPDGQNGFFVIAINDGYAGSLMADYAVKDMGKKRIGVICDQTDGTIGIYEAFKAEAEKLGATITIFTKYVGGQDKDFSVQLTKIKGTNPDLILISCFDVEGAMIVNQAKSLGITTQLMIPDAGSTPAFLKLTGKNSNGVIAANNFNRNIDTPAVKSFMQKYDAQFPGADILASGPYAYDAVYTLAAIIKSTNSTDFAKMQQALFSYSGQGVTGPIKFATNGARSAGPLVIQKIENGQAIVLKTILLQ